MSKNKKLGVFIGRFQPFHAGHLFVIEEALKQVDELLVLVGSAGQPSSYFNPFSYEQRVQMIGAALSEESLERVEFGALADFTYDDQLWMATVQATVDNFVNAGDGPREVMLVGHRKDGTGYYLDMFPQWGGLGVANFDGLSATQVRERFFLTDAPLDPLRVPNPIISWLEDFRTSAAYAPLAAEYQHVEMYQQQYRDLEFAPIHVTVDAVVIRSGHVLLVKRKNMPGRGLWALPGGFLDAKERIQDAVYRELIEETGIGVPEAELRAHTKVTRVFDAVYRSSRGRTITHASLIVLPNGPLPPLEPQQEEVTEVEWKPLGQAGLLADMFEDHGAIIHAMYVGKDK